MFHYTNYEKETVILYNEEEKTAHIETANRSLIDRLDSFCEQSDDIKCVKVHEPFKDYILPKKWIKIRMPRQYTEEEKTALRERGKALYEKLRNKQSNDES